MQVNEYRSTLSQLLLGLAFAPILLLAMPIWALRHYVEGAASTTIWVTLPILWFLYSPVFLLCGAAWLRARRLRLRIDDASIEQRNSKGQLTSIPWSDVSSAMEHLVEVGYPTILGIQRRKVRLLRIHRGDAEIRVSTGYGLGEGRSLKAQAVWALSPMKILEFSTFGITVKPSEWSMVRERVAVVLSEKASDVLLEQGENLPN